MAHLLIVDNDARIVELTAYFLEREGHAVETALSYAEARRRIAARAPELMLADLDLGLESGREELPRLAREGLLPPTLVVSGFLDAELEDELCAVPGVRGTLTKPIDLDRLAARIREELAAGVLQPEARGAASPAEDEEGWIEIVPLAPDVPPRVEGPAAEPPTAEPPTLEPPTLEPPTLERGGRELP